MEKIQVFVMTRNRPDTVVKAIDSVIGQTYPDFEIVVSDNSTNEDTSKLLESYVSSNIIKYIRQDPMAGIDHLNKVHDMAEANYYMIFHDDDTMHPEMLQTLYDCIIRYPEASAVATNANIIKNDIFFRLAFKDKKTIELDSVDDLIARYGRKYNIAPFPSYMYVREKVRDLRVCYAHGGKYADVSFLADLAMKGKIIYIPQPLMDYYIHEGQDSARWDFTQYITLTNYLHKVVNSKEVVRPLRFTNLYHEILQEKHVPLFSKKCLCIIKHAPILNSLKLIANKLGFI